MSQNNAALPKGKTREFVGGSEQCSSSPPAPSSTRIRISSHAMWSMSESNPGDFAHCLPHIRTKQLSGCDDDCSHQALWVLHGSAVSGWWVGEREQQGRAPLQRCACVGIARRQGDACSGAGGVWCGHPPGATLPSHLYPGVNRAHFRGSRAGAFGGAPRPSRWSDHLADHNRLPVRAWVVPARSASSVRFILFNRKKSG